MNTHSPIRKITADEILAFIIACLVFILYFRAHLFDPNHRLIDHGFDGFKNYFTFGYNVRHGGGLWFDGMAYPYGEHILYTDAQPGISAPLAWLNKVFPIIGENTSLIVNWLMCISAAVSSLLLVKCFKFLNVNGLIAVVLSISITYLSPQIFRMSLHHALAYTSVIPFILLICFYYLRNQSIKYPIILGSALFYLGFIHAYYLVMCGLFVLGLFTVQSIRL
jgi:hypothetical protein